MYEVNNQKILLPTKKEPLVLSLTSNSGRLVYRDKINTVIGIKHPGIELGSDQLNYRWILHHHYKNGVPYIEREDAFSLGNYIFYDERFITYNQYHVVEKALAAWWQRKEYHWLWQNCQHFVNEIIYGEHKSESVEKISNGLLFSGFIATILGLLLKNKTLFVIGCAGMGSGVAGKYINRSF